MGHLLRSKSGCWTCRLRKKKCDETKPECSTCHALTITCYGYGPRPDWMDNGDAEKAMVDSLKQIVKSTSRRTSRFRILPGQKTKPQLAPKGRATLTATATVIAAAPDRSTAASTQSTSTSRRTGATPLSDHGLRYNESADSPPSPKSAQHSPIGAISAEDSILLMHFLDQVFPLQYPMYRPDTLNGGRGWLFALLLQTKSLYYAALTLSSYHQRVLISETISRKCLASTTVQQEQHLETCLIEVRQAMVTLDQRIRHREPLDGLGTVISIVQLVFFELFAGQDNAWRTHLNAAIDVYDRNCRDKLAHIDLSETSKTILREDRQLGPVGALVAQEVIAFRFMGGSIIWLDILSSLTSGTVPRTLSHHGSVLQSTSQMGLENIMGCKNWLMCQVGRIATLQGHRRQAGWASQRKETEFGSIAADIKSSIEGGLAREGLENLEITRGEHFGKRSTSLSSDYLITQMFAFMAVAHLHLVMYDFEHLEDLTTTITEAIQLLQLQIPSSMLPAIVAPLFMIGCVAAEGDEQDFFRAALVEASQQPLYKHRREVLSTLEQTWNKRRTSTEITWDQVLEISQRYNLLLL